MLKKFYCCGRIVQVMKHITVTQDLRRYFRSNPQTLIFDGYIANFTGAAVFCNGNNYALTAQNAFGGTECCLYCEDIGLALDFVSGLSGKVKLCGISPELTSALSKRYKSEWITKCNLYVWNGKPLNLDVIDCDIRPLDGIYAADVSNGTPYHADIRDVAECLRRHPSAAVYADGKPVCWCLLHLEGDLGMLYTVPQYRRQGYALKVMTALTQTVIEKGDIPYAYIIDGNVASENLAPKYNIERVCRADYLEINLDKIN